MKDLKLEYRNPADLVPYVNNAKRHSEAQVDQLAASIKEFGFTNPILLDDENGVIAGHARLLAARKLKLNAVPIVALGHLADAERRAYIIADNRLAETGASWNFDALFDELTAIRVAGFDSDLSGFDIERLGAGPDKKDTSAAPDADKNDKVQCPRCGHEF